MLSLGLLITDSFVTALGVQLTSIVTALGTALGAIGILG